MGRIHKSIDVQAPIEACYRVWIDFGNYPQFMKHVESITQKGAPNVWHWKVKGPNNIPLEWDAELDAVKHENRVISWHTVRQADVASSGAITLEALNGTVPQTRINVVVEYVPQSNRLELQEDKLLEFVNHRMEEGLKNFKQLVEQTQFAKPQPATGGL